MTLRSNSTTWYILAWCIGISVCFFVYTFAISAHAQTQTKEDLEQKIAELTKSIAAIDAELNAIAGQKSTLSSHIAELQLNRKKLSSQIATADAQLKREKAKVARLSESISDHTKTQSVHRGTIARLLRGMYAADEESGVALLLKSTDLKAFLHSYSDLPTVFASLGTATRRLAQVNEVLAKEKTETELSVKKTSQLTSQIKSQKSVFDSLHQEASVQLKTTAEQEKQFQLQRAELEKLKAAFEQELYAYEAGLGFAGINKTTPKPGTKVFAWPLDDVFVTQLFGKTSASARLYLSGSHSGVDFRASIGTPVKAMANGIVMGTGDTDTACKGASFGKWVYIAFQNGLGATYGHLSSIAVKKGQSVATGDIIGYSGKTGHATGPHLHVSVYALQDSNGASVVQIASKESIACKGKLLVQPRAPIESYLNLLDYTGPVDSSKIKL